MSSYVDTASFSSTGDLPGYVDSRTEAKWASDIRRSALRIFSEQRWPTTSDEEWRRSDISYYDFDSYEYRGEVDEAGEATEGASRIEIHMERATALSLSLEARGSGVRLLPIGRLLAETDDEHGPLRSKAAQALARDLRNIDHRIQSWHYAAMNSGVALYVPPFVELSEPINIDVHTSGDKHLVAPHILVILDTGAAASVVEQVTGEDEDEVLYNGGKTLVLGDGARLDYAGFNDVNIDSVVFDHCFAYLGRDAALQHFTGAFGGMFAKHRADVHVLGEGADARIDGLYFAREDQHLDLRTVQYHRAPNSGSRTFYKGAVQDEGRSVYQGLIEVAHGADKTDAYLTNNNLILNDGARADSIPSLQIQTDDVKCSHGSTTGKIDENQLYYLMTRGYSETEAREIIVEGYFEEIAGTLEDGLAAMIRSTVRRRLAETDE